MFSLSIASLRQNRWTRYSTRRAPARSATKPSRANLHYSHTYAITRRSESSFAIFAIKVSCHAFYKNIWVFKKFILAGFTQAANLRNHERIHTNDRPYVCVDCGKQFTQVRKGFVIKIKIQKKYENYNNKNFKKFINKIK